MKIAFDRFCDEYKLDFKTQYDIDFFDFFKAGADWQKSVDIDALMRRYMGDNNREDMEVLRCVEELTK